MSKKQEQDFYAYMYVNVFQCATTCTRVFGVHVQIRGFCNLYGTVFLRYGNKGLFRQNLAQGEDSTGINH